MLPKAYIVHQLHHRVRFRLPEMRHEAEFFEQVKNQISKLNQVAAVEVSEVTGSIMISHPETNFENLEPQLAKLDLFEINLTPPPVTPAKDILSSSVSQLDQMISEGSSGGVDLNTLAFTAVLGIALFQMTRGNFIGPAIPMLLSGMDLLRKVSDNGQDQTN